MKQKSLLWTTVGVVCVIVLAIIAGLVIWLQRSQDANQNEPDNFNQYVQADS